MENWNELKDNWGPIKEKLNQKFGMLTESDLLLSEGKQDELLNRLQTKLGRTKAEITVLITQLNADVSNKNGNGVLCNI